MPFPAALPLIIGGIGAAGGAGLSLMQAGRQNSAMSRAMDAQARSAGIQQKQIANQSFVQQQETMRQARQLEGRIRVAAGEAGATFGGSFAAMSNQSAFDAARNQQIIRSNATMQQQAVRTGAEANIASLAAQYKDPIISGLMGGMQGLSAGLAIGGVVSQIGQLMNAGGATANIGGAGAGAMPSYGGNIATV